MVISKHYVLVLNILCFNRPTDLADLNVDIRPIPSVKMIFRSDLLNKINNYQTPYILGLSIFLSRSNSGKLISCNI